MIPAKTALLSLALATTIPMSGCTLPNRLNCRSGLCANPLSGLERLSVDQRSAIRAYYAAFKDRDRQTLERLLMPNLRFRSPFGEYDDRDRMLDDIWPSVGRVWAVDIEIYGDGPAYMVRYRHNVEGSATLVEHVRFEGSQIAEIEVYLDRVRERR